MKIRIIGSGVYGLGTANKLSQYNKDLIVWTERNVNEISSLSKLKFTNSYEELLKDADIVYILISTKFIKSCIDEIKKYAEEKTLFIIGSKGILDDGTFIYEYFKEALPNNHVGVISGPTFAVDVNALEPVGFTFASTDKKDFDKLEKIYQNTLLEYTNDVKAISLSGVIKNVYAIGNGIIDGLGLGYSTKCLLVYKALNEMKFIFNSMDLKESTSNTLAGIGDLILTSTSPTSRNFTFGIICAKGSKEEKQTYLDKTTVEGYENLIILYKLFKNLKIKTPLLNSIYDVVIKNKTSDVLIKALLR